MLENYPFLFFFIIALITSIPISKTFNWLVHKTYDINELLDTPNTNIQVSFAPQLFFITKILEFLKGYLPLYFAANYFENELFIFATALILLCIHYWSPLNGFKPNEQLWWITWGCYSLFSPVLGILYPILYALCTLFTNSIYLSPILNTTIFFFLIWLLDLSPIFQTINFIIFIIVFLANNKQIFNHFDNKPIRLIDSFQNRS